MKRTHWPLLVGILALACTAPAAAQQRRMMMRPTAYRNVNYSYNTYEEEAEEEAAADSSCSSCDAPSCASTEEEECEECPCYCFGPAEACTLFNSDNCHGITIAGWTQIGYSTFSDGQYNDHPYNVDLHQQWIYMEKLCEPDECGSDWGYRIDYVYGTDGPDTQAFGNPPDTWDFGWNNGGFYGHAIPQLFAQYGYDKWKVTAGHFYTRHGYEVVTAPGNFFFSHAFTNYNSEPFTHTGVMLDYTPADGYLVSGGWVAGWDTGFEKFGGDLFMGHFKAPVTEKINAHWVVCAGNQGFGTNFSGSNHTFMLDFAVTDQFTYVIQSDYVNYTGQDDFSIAQYGIYRVNDCWGFGTRFEWWNRQVAIGDNVDLYELTVGLNYKPHANFLLRPEVRWQWDKDDSGIIFPQNFDNRAGFGMDMIMTF